MPDQTKNLQIATNAVNAGFAFMRAFGAPGFSAANSKMQIGAIAVTVANENVDQAAEWLIESGWEILEGMPARGVHKLTECTLIIMPEISRRTDQVAADMLRRRVESCYGVAQ